MVIILSVLRNIVICVESPLIHQVKIFDLRSLAMNDVMTASGAEEFIRLTARTAYPQLYMYARSIPPHLTTSERIV